MSARNSFGLIMVFMALSCSDKAEGSEFHNELLWNIYQQKTKLTLQALSEIEPPLRREIIEKEYQEPLLDYNYIAILDSLKNFDSQESFISDLRLMMSYLEELAKSVAKH